MIYRLILILLLSGCAGNKTVIRHHGEVIWTITGSGDKQLVEVTSSSGTVKIDSRSSSVIKDMIQYLMIKKTTETRLQ